MNNDDDECSRNCKKCRAEQDQDQDGRSQVPPRVGLSSAATLAAVVAPTASKALAAASP